MLTVKGNMVLCDSSNVEALFSDTRNVIATFVKISRDCNISDEEIEKTLIEFIVSSFKIQDEILSYSKKRTGDIEKDISELLRRYKGE